MLIVLTDHDRVHAQPGLIGAIAHQQPDVALWVIDLAHRAGAVIRDRRVVHAWDSPPLPFDPSAVTSRPDWVTQIEQAIANFAAINPLETTTP